MKPRLTYLLAYLMIAMSFSAVAAEESFDLVIYGSSPAAISAAVQAKRMGKRAVVVSPETRIGGLTTGGLGQTDIGNKSAFGGLALEFYRDVADYYRDEANWKWQKRGDYLPDGQCAGTKGEDSMWTFEPSAALRILEGWEKRDGLVIRRGEFLDRGKGGVERKDGRIVAIRTLKGNVYRGRMFVDATYEGDLMAAAGVSYTVGREANSVYGETISGYAPDADGAWNHNLNDGVSAYVKPGDKNSGLLPGIEPYDPKAKPGDGDRRVQAYCFRMCLTDMPENRIPFKKPANYDERNYELLFRDYEAAWSRPESRPVGARVWPRGSGAFPAIMSRMPNRKTDTNNRCGFSTDFIGRNWAWPEASYEERERILKAHLDYQQGLMWTLANHPRVPERVRAHFSKFGTCRDEFEDGLGDGWQRQLYVREARRMVGDYVMTEHNCRGAVSAARPVAMGAYTMDSHHVRRMETRAGTVRNEGNVEDDRFGGPYGIDYGAIVPKRGECANLFVPVCVSASHMAFGSIRMEPVFFALGQVAATAAAQAIDAGCAVQDLKYAGLRRRLLADGQVIAQPGLLEPIVPAGGPKSTTDVPKADELRDIRARTGFRRFFVTGPGKIRVINNAFPADLPVTLGREIRALKEELADTDIEIGWWCAPSIRYASGFSPIEDEQGNRSVESKCCPLDPAFAADWAAKIRAVAAEAHPSVINIEDDYTLSWGRGIKGFACCCPRHLAAVAKRCGRPVTREELGRAFAERTPGNRALRQAFAEATRDSLVSLAAKVRAAVDEVDPSIRLMLCESNGDVDGNATEPILRALAGGNRPMLRPAGAIYGAQAKPSAISSAVAHTFYTVENLPRDVEMYYEADTYPHNRFYSPASQLLSMVAGAMMAGSENVLFYCLQHLDDPLEDTGYVDAFNALRPRLQIVRDFVRARDAHLAGVRVAYDPADSYLTRDRDGHGSGVPAVSAYMLSKFGIPYTMRQRAKGPAVLVGPMAETLTDGEVRRLLSGGVLVDAPAADALAKRGFGRLLGTGVELAKDRLPIAGEFILPAAGCTRAGKRVYANYLLPAGTEGTVRTFAVLRPAAGTETWCEFRGLEGNVITPSLTLARNELGGRVAVLGVSLAKNFASGLYNLRKQELFRRLFARLDPNGVPVAALDAPGIWTLANVAADGRSMLVMANNLSGDERENLRFGFSPEWAGAKISWLRPSGSQKPLGRTSAEWTAPQAFGQMLPEFFLVEK